MERLPLETLIHISSYLEIERASLESLSFSNKLNRQACKTFLFRHIRIGLKPGEVRAICERWNNALKDAGSVQHVRSLEFFALIPFQPKDPFRKDAPKDPAFWKYVLRREDGMIADRYCDAPSRNVLKDAEVHALLDLLRALRSLRHLTWDCPWQPIPSAIPDLLVEKGCRLNVASFRLHSLLQRSSAGQPVGIDANDLQLATSPCLESLTLLCAPREVEYENYNYDAVLDMISGAAPNLRDVTLRIAPHYLCSQDWYARVPRIPWPSDLLPNSRTCSGPLRCLDISQNLDKEMPVLSTNMDFAVLRVLRIGAVGADKLRWLTGYLPSLKTLEISFQDDRGPKEDLQVAVQAFFLSLPQLDCLTFSGETTRRTLEVILQRHGPGLRALHSSELVLYTCIDLVHRFCVVLEELSLSVQRTQGDAKEVSIYQTLGMLPIRYLSISFRQKNPDHTPEYFNGPRRNGFIEAKILRDCFSETELRDLIINCTVDQALAQAIFKKVDSPRNDLALPPLERLDLGVENFSYLFNGGYLKELKVLITNISRSWKCTRNPRDDAPPSDCWVKEVGQRAELAKADGELDPWVEQVVRGIWTDSGPWKDICHSLPLADDSTQEFVSTTVEHAATTPLYLSEAALR